MVVRGGLEREAGPLRPRAGLSSAHPVLHARGLGASCLPVPRTPPTPHPEGRAGGSGVSHQGGDLITEGRVFPGGPQTTSPDGAGTLGFPKLGLAAPGVSG